MGRLNTYVDFKNTQATDISNVLSEVGVTGQLYRSANTVNNSVGFGTELSTTSYLRNILIYLEVMNPNPQESGVASKLKLLGITQDLNVLIGDQIIIKERTYQVTAVNNTFINHLELTMELIV